MTSPSTGTTGTIRVSCDSSHQIHVTLTCTNCTNPLLITYGSSPLIVRGLDPGVIYSVIINVFDDNQIVLRNQTVMLTITVMDDKSSKAPMQCTMVCQLRSYIMYWDKNVHIYCMIVYHVAQNFGGSIYFAFTLSLVFLE